MENKDTEQKKPPKTFVPVLLWNRHVGFAAVKYFCISASDGSDGGSAVRPVSHLSERGEYRGGL